MKNNSTKTKILHLCIQGVFLLTLFLIVFSCSEKPGKWLAQDFSEGFGILKMGNPETIGRFGGGGWARVNGADFDGDGDIDLAVNFGRGGNASGTFAGLYIYENIGNKTDGLLNEGTKLSDKEGDVFVGHANNDGLMDIYCEGDLFINQSTGNNISFTKTKNAEQPDWPTPGEYDWDNDGLKDKFIMSQWHLELVDGNSGDTTRLMVGESEWLEDIFIRPFVCDWDGDNDPDLLIGQESGHITFIENSSGTLLGEKHLLQKNPNVKSGCAVVPTLCDWDNDGDIDIIAGTSAGFLELYENENGEFKPVKRLEASGKVIRIEAGELGSVQGPGEARWGYLCPFATDWDLDGDIDIVAGCVTGQNLFFENIGTAQKPELAEVQYLQVDWDNQSPVYPDGMRYEPEPNQLITQWRCRPVVMDWNGDDLPDYLTIDEKGTLACYPRYRRADGSLGLKPATYPFLGESNQPLAFCTHKTPGRNGRIKFSLADWDGDGDLDIIRNGGLEDGTKNLDNGLNFSYLECIKTEDNTSVFKWRGELMKTDKIHLQGHTDSPIVFDVDGNGSPDIISGCEDGNIYWFLHKWIENENDSE
jgi:hypothetical protein